MAYTIKELRNKSNEELITEHDKKVPLVSVGINYYIDELNRRSAESTQKEMKVLAHESNRLSKKIYRQSWITAVATVLALLISATSLTLVILQ